MLRYAYRPLFAFAALLIIGCRETPVEVETPAPVAIEFAEPSSAAEQPTATVEVLRAPQVQQTTYQPPFPERSELFVPPEREISALAVDTENGEDRVRLNGFVNVDGQRAILMIDGQLASLAAGSERYGVKVVDIAPPKVTLERGGNQWTTSIE